MACFAFSCCLHSIFFFYSDARAEMVGASGREFATVACSLIDQAAAAAGNGAKHSGKHVSSVIFFSLIFCHGFIYHTRTYTSMHVCSSIRLLLLATELSTVGSRKINHHFKGGKEAKHGD